MEGWVTGCIWGGGIFGSRSEGQGDGGRSEDIEKRGRRSGVVVWGRGGGGLIKVLIW